MNIGQIVTITDLDIPMTGVITKVVPSLTLGDVTVYQVTTLTGTKWAREEADLVPATEADSAEFVRDVKILAPHHADLAEAFAQVIGPLDEVVPGIRLVDLALSTRMPSGVVLTRRDVAAEMIRTAATVVTPTGAGGPRIRTVTEMI